MAESLLSDGDLAYMRGVQALARPTDATLRPRTSTRTATGGTTTTLGDPVPLTVRVDAAADEVPAPMAARLGTATPYRITLDVARDVRDGDRIDVTPTEQYELVSDGDPDTWATAQVVWARRVTFPTRTA